MNKIKEIAIQLAEIVEQKKLLSLKEDTLRMVLLDLMEDDGLSNYNDEHIAATRAVRKTYTYSPAIKVLEEKLAIGKDAEVRSGVAVMVEKPYLIVKAVEN